MNFEKEVSIFGAGFSGLVSAYFLNKAGFQVFIYEKDSRVGGLIQTEETPYGKFETAANGILNSYAFQELTDQIGVELIGVRSVGKRRYFFRDGKALRWPLYLMETVGLLVRLPFLLFKRPKPGETVRDWAVRVLGMPTYIHLLAPGLQGIYAGNPEQLDANLVFGHFFKKSKKLQPPKIRGTVAPRGGMSTLMASLRKDLEDKGVRFFFDSKVTLNEVRGAKVIATSLPSAVELLRVNFSEASTNLSGIEMIPLVSVSIAFSEGTPILDGFGCLFPRDVGIRSLGVLCEEVIFGDRSHYPIERWILGGFSDRKIVTDTRDKILDSILEDRARLYGDKTLNIQPIHVTLSLWNPALPHYTTELSRALESNPIRDLEEKHGIILMGNYTGRLGLSGILKNAVELPNRIMKVKQSNG